MTTSAHLSLDSMRPTAFQSSARLTTQLRGVGRRARTLESIRAYWSIAEASRFVERGAMDSKQDQTVERLDAGIVKRGRRL